MSFKKFSRKYLAAQRTAAITYTEFKLESAESNDSVLPATTAAQVTRATSQ